jgi:hypothetical protein
MRMTPMAWNSVAVRSRRQSRPLAGLGVVCLISVVGIVITAFVCFLGFRSEITAALSEDMTGSISVQDQITKAEVKTLAVQPTNSHH